MDGTPMPYVDGDANAWNKDLTRRYCSRIGINLIWPLHDDAEQNTLRHARQIRTSMKFESPPRTEFSPVDRGQLDAVSVSDLRVELDKLVARVPAPWRSTSRDCA
jgi:hypothetical protein